MKNVELSRDGDSLTIRVDLTETFGPLSSGKTIIIASTEGTVPVGPDRGEKIGRNVYRPREGYGGNFGALFLRRRCLPVRTKNRQPPRNHKEAKDPISYPLNRLGTATWPLQLGTV